MSILDHYNISAWSRYIVKGNEVMFYAKLLMTVSLMLSLLLGCESKKLPQAKKSPTQTVDPVTPTPTRPTDIKSDHYQPPSSDDSTVSPSKEETKTCTTGLNAWICDEKLNGNSIWQSSNGKHLFYYIISVKNGVNSWQEIEFTQDFKGIRTQERAGTFTVEGDLLKVVVTKSSCLGLRDLTHKSFDVRYERKTIGETNVISWDFKLEDSKNSKLDDMIPIIKVPPDLGTRGCFLADGKFEPNTTADL